MQIKRLRIAIQKKGKLNHDSIELLIRCGLKFRIDDNSLIARSENLPVDILLVRDDDIPTMVMDDVCDLGIVGENVLFEKEIYQKNNGFQANFNLVRQLGFGRCRLSIAVPEDFNFVDSSSLESLRIATSYSHLLKSYLNKHNIFADIIKISGSVEISTRLGMADAICDLVSTGRTLEENKLKEVAVLIKSEAVLIKTNQILPEEKEHIFSILLRRIQSVLQAQESKYILFHAPKNTLDEIKKILPGFESPTIMPLDGNQDKVAVHLVSAEAVFWDTLEKLKQIGASSILVLPIEKMMS